MTKPWWQQKRLIAAGILLFFCLVPGIFSCKNDEREIQRLIKQISFDEDRAEDVLIIFSENGKVKGRLFANVFIMNEQAKPPFMDARNGLRIESFGDSLQVQSTLTAKYGRYYPQDGNILLRDSIIVFNAKGERLATEELVWNDKMKKFYTEKPVRIKTPTQVIYGDGLEANQDFSQYQITNIKGIIQVDKDEVPAG